VTERCLRQRGTVADKTAINEKFCLGTKLCRFNDLSVTAYAVPPLLSGEALAPSGEKLYGSLPEGLKSPL